jgi:hypothetical protein
MKTTHLLTPVKIVAAAAYSAIFPLTNLVGGATALFGIVSTLPFLPLAWLGGMVLVSIAGEGAYLWGAAIAVFFQVSALLALWSYIHVSRT